MKLVKDCLKIFLVILIPMKDLMAQLSPAPVITIRRDDHVATIEMDYNAFAGWGGQLWNVSDDGLDPVGYLVKWWPNASANVVPSMGCSSSNSTGTPTIATESNPHQLVTPNPITQIQPIANNVLYHVKVEKINSLGQVCSPATELTFMGGDETRVNDLRTTMTFFDDFNWQMGPADELKWNNAMVPQTDPRFNLFFINAQCHSHTLNGTYNEGAGDKSEVAQRPRKPILIENGVRRRIVFDMDGIFSGRSVWYLDLNPVKTDLTGHLSFFDFDGDQGLPADVFRIKANGHSLSVSLIDGQGASYKIGEAHLPDFGRAMSTNVRRFFDVRLGTDGVEIFVDSVSVINVPFSPGAFKPGVYDLLWSTVGYNTSKDDVPYFLSHWDNFGFDGPNVEPFIVHNYVTQIMGTDLQHASSWNNQNPTFMVHVPDDIRPVVPGVKNEVYLVFSYLKNDYSSFNIEPGDHLLFNGVSFPLPEGGNNSSVPGLVDYSGSPISNRIKIGEVMQGGVSPVHIGHNEIQFFASNTGIVNLHIEVFCPESAPPPPYTQPSAMHHVVHHHALPKTGPAAKIVFIDEEEWSYDANNEVGPTLSNIVPVEVLVGNGNWANWAPNWLNIPATSAEQWTTGSTNGIKKIELFIRAKGSTENPGQLLTSLNTSQDVPAPQIRYTFQVDTRTIPNGDYDLFFRATANDGTSSHPAYSGFGFEWDVSELSGAYAGIPITIVNVPGYVFKGTNGPLWTQSTNWESGIIPPSNYTGQIVIDADCEVPATSGLHLAPGAIILINANKKMTVK
ncbi:MAG: hypothetical protein WAT92_02620 [Saprospiraceae bacterium]